MKARTGPERVGSLVIELAARTARIDGTRVELPPTEFALLAVLSARPGEVVSHKTLAAEAFGEGAPMAPHDLHWRIWKLRDVIGDGNREHKLVENRRGQGYVLDLPPNAVQVVEGVAPETAPVDEVIQLEEQSVPAITKPTSLADDLEADLPVSLTAIDTDDTPSGSRRTRPRPVAVLVGVVITVAALAGSWSAGYLISTRVGNQERTAVPPPTDKATSSSVADPDLQRREQGRSERRKPDKAAKKPRKEGSKEDPNAVAAAPAPAAPPPPPSQSGSSGGQGGETQPARQPKPAAPLPAPPTRFLHHLVNANTGDHFVTSDGNVASQYHARGYEGGAIGRVYTSAVKGTRAISTNQGTAHIFIESSPKTEPASRAVALWYSTDNAGDFFYTTSEAEAKQSGWSARVVGYVGAL